MHLYQIIIEYDGTNYVGWQKQRNGKSIQETIEKVLKKKIKIKNNVSNISVPGQFKIHYSPGLPIRLNVKK